MGICSYCQENKKLTKEHIFPKFLYERTPYESQFYKKINKLVNTELVIRDVCKNCNSVILSNLDDYISTIFTECLHKFVKIKQKVTFKYDFDKLCRWVLKVSYNSARINSTAKNFDSEIINYILNGKKKPKGTKLFIKTIEPYKLNEKDKKRVSQEVDEILTPSFTRIAKFYNENFNNQIKIGYLISINSYYFYILIPHNNFDKKIWKILIDDFKKKEKTFELLSKKECIALKPSNNIFNEIPPYLLMNEKVLSENQTQEK